MKKILLFLLVFALMLSVVSCYVNYDNDDNSEENSPPPAVEAPKFDDKTLVSLGDSLTYTTAHGYVEYYPQTIEKLLGFNTSVNLGIPGSTVANCVNRDPMCNRYLEIPSDADVITFMGGLNDIYASVPLGTAEDTDTTTFYGALNTIAKGLTENYPDAYIVFCTVLPGLEYQDASDLNTANYSIIDMNTAIKTVASNYHIDVCDLYTLCGEYKASNYDVDGDHPTQEFLTNSIAYHLADFIKKNYK